MLFRSELPFEDYMNEEDLNSMLTNRSGRGSGVGIKSFKWVTEGTNSANKYSFSAEIEFFFQNIEDLFRIRRVDQVNSNKVETSYSDLIKQSKKSIAQSEFNPEYFRLKAMVGWQIPKNNVDFINQDFKEEVKSGNVSLYLSLHSHELDITEIGRAHV